MSTGMNVRPRSRGCVVGLGLGQYRFVGSGVGLLIAAMVPSLAMAGPEGARVVSGQATIRQNGDRTVIRAGDRTIIQYSRFNLSANESVRFVQPSATSRVLNRIDGAEPTRINGSVSANGVVYFVNPSGVMFGPNSVVNTNGLFAAAGQMTNRDFLNNVNRFTNLKGDVVNQGRIESGMVALVGASVSNAGIINADQGVIAMVAGDEVVLSKSGEPMSVRVSPDNAALRDPAKVGVTNSGALRAKGGKVRVLAGDMYSLAINDTGSIDAKDVELRGAGSGRVAVSGKIDASNQVDGGRGGRVAITGEHVALTGAKIDASGTNGGGTVLVGGGAHGQGDLRTATTTFVDAHTSIDADAKATGKGGEVVVWSNTHSAVYGDLSARGGATGGDGGFIETSGKVTLDLRDAQVDASAEHGLAGTWLLDPFDVTISNATVNGAFDGMMPTDTYTPTGTGATVDAGAISTALSMGASGTNVVITTAGAGAEPGNITVTSPITKNSATTATLTLQADGSIAVSATIGEAGAGKLNVVLDAAAAITINSAISTRGGDFTARGTTFTNNADVTSLGGNILVNHSGHVILNAALDASAGLGMGSVTLTGTDLTIAPGVGSITSGLTGVTIRPLNTSTLFSLNGTTGAGIFEISAAELGRITVPTGAPVTFGLNTVGVDVGSAGSVDLDGTGLATGNVRLEGSTITFNDFLGLGQDRTLTLVGGSVAGDASSAGNDARFAGTGGVLKIETTGNATLSTDATFLDTSSVGGNLDLGVLRSFSQVGGAVIGGTTRVRSYGNAGVDIGMGNNNNSFGGIVTLQTLNAAGAAAAPGAVTVASNTAYTLKDIISGGDADATSGGDLTIQTPMTLGANATFASSGGMVTLSDAITTVGNLTLDADTAVNVNGTITSMANVTLLAGTNANINQDVTATDRVSVVAGDVVIDTVGGATITAGAAGVLLAPSTDLASIAINDGRTMGAFSVSEAELQAISTTGTVTIGRSTSTGGVNIGSLGAIDLSGRAYSMLVRGGDTDFAAGITMPTDRQFSLLSSGGISRSNMGVADVIIGGNAGAILLRAADDIDFVSRVSQIAARSLSGDITIANNAGPGLSVTQLGVLTPDAGTVTIDGLSASSGRSISLDTNTTLALVRPISVPAGTANVSATGTIFVPGGTDPRVIAGILSIASTTGSIGGGGTLYTTLGTMGTPGTLIASAPNGLNIDNATGGDLVDVILNSVNGTARLSNAGRIVGASGTPWVMRGLDLTSTNDLVWLKDDVTITGTIANINSARLFILDAGQTITASSANLALTVGDLALEGSLNAMSVGVNLAASTTGFLRTSVGVGLAAGDLRIDNAELGRITTPLLTIGGANAKLVTVDGVDLSGAMAPDRVDFYAAEATGRLVFGGAASTFKQSAAWANNGVDVNVNVTTTVGSLAIDGDRDDAAAPSSASDKVTIAGGVTLTGKTNLTVEATTGGIMGMGAVTLRADDGVLLQSAYSNTAGDTTINADFNSDGTGTFTQASGATITTTGGGNNRNVLITAADVDLGAPLNLGAGTLTIGRANNGELWLGDVSGAPGMALKIDAAELAQIAAGSVAFGGTSTTLVNVSGLRNNQMGNSFLDRMRVTGAISLTGGDINITPNALDAGQADLTLSRATPGTVGVGSATGDMTIDTSELSRIIAKSLTVQNINPSQASDNTTRNMTVRDVMEGQLAGIDGGVSFRAGNTLSLIDTAPGNPASFRFKQLTASANNGLNVNATLTTTTGDLTLNGDADDTAQTADGIKFFPGVALTSARDLVIQGAAGARSDVGLTANAVRDVLIQTVMTTNGLTTINADTNLDGSGSLVVTNAGRINTSSNNLVITAADVRLGTGSSTALALQTGAGSVSIDRTTLGTINIGVFDASDTAVAATMADPMIISNTELGRILATGLTIGGSNANLIRVEGVTAAASERVVGVTTLNALGAGGAINFDSAASTFNAVEAKAVNGITVNRDLTADSGGITLDGGAGTAGFGDGAVALGASLLGATTGDVNVRSVATLTTGTVRVTGNDITFNSTIDSDTVGARALVLASSNNGVTTLSGNVGATNSLASIRTNEDGSTTVGGDVKAQTSIRFEDATELLAATPTIETSGGTGVRFGGPAKVRGTIRANGATGEIKFRDTTQSTGPTTIVTTGGGAVNFQRIARLRGSVSSALAGSIGFAGGLNTLDDVTVGQTGTGNVTFGSNVFSTGGAHDLTVSVGTPSDTPSTPTALPGPIPTIRFAGPVGTNTTGATAPLGTVRLNAGGRTTVPRSATIAATTSAGVKFDLTGDFVMGQNEKLVSLGPVTINANKARLGDISAVGDIRVTAASNAADAITLQVRPKQQLLVVNFDVNMPSNAQTLGTVAMDDGLDFVSAFGEITFNRTPMLTNNTDPRPTFGTREGSLGGDPSVLDGFLVRRFQNEFEASAVPQNRVGEILRSSDRFLDLKASGPSVANFAAGIAQAVPRDNRVDAVGQDSSIDSTTKDTLADMSLNPREASTAELIDLLGGAATFDDTPSKIGQVAAQDYEIVLNRLPYQATRSVAKNYVETFGEKAERAQRSAAIKASLAESLKRYRSQRAEPTTKTSASKVDPIAFRGYLEQTPAESQTLGYVQQIGAFFRGLGTLGLTRSEFNRVRDSVLTPLLPKADFQNISEFERVFTYDDSMVSR